MVNTSFDVGVLDVEELISELLAKTAESNTCMAFCNVHTNVHAFNALLLYMHASNN